MEKLPTEKKVDCINISFAPVRTTIEDLLQRFTDALISALKKGNELFLQLLTTLEIQQQCTEAEKFINNAVDVLSKPPQTVEEIGAVTAESKRLLETKPQIKAMLEKAEAKNKLLRSVAGGGNEYEILNLFFRSQYCIGSQCMG